MGALFDYDAELRWYNLRLLEAAGVGRGDRVLDVGCGSGQATREAARRGESALGVDVAEAMLEVARKLAAEEGVGNASFEVGDAQRYPFGENQFDVAISRFGTMFFDDPVVAFANIGRAAPRLVMLVWQSGERQEWLTSVRGALGPADAGADAAFSLGDPAVTNEVLTSAGFANIGITEIREPVYYGRDAAAAFDMVIQLRMAGIPLSRLVGVERERAQDRLRATLSAHETSDGVWFDSRAWLVTANRGGHG